MEFAKKLSKLIKLRNDSQARIAADLGVSQNLVGTWCRGESEPGLSRAVFLAKRFGVPLEYLANDALDEPPSPEVIQEERSLMVVFRTYQKVHGLSAQEISDALAEVFPDPARRKKPGKEAL